MRAAIQLFADRGPDATTIAMLARRARVNRRMLYYYFGNKEGLYRAAIEDVYVQSSVIEDELSLEALSAEELIERFIRSHHEFLTKHPEFVRLLLWENLRQGCTAREVDMAGLKAPAVDALHAALKRGKAEGRIRKTVDAKQLFISCLALSYFYFSNQYTVGRALGFDLTTPKAIEKRVTHVVRLLLDGIRAHSNVRGARRRA